MSDEIPIVGGNRTRVKPGQYDAIVISYHRVNKFKRWQVLFRFRIFELGPYHDVELDGYAALSRDQTVKADSKLARWSRLIAEWGGGRKDRISLSAFKRFAFRVEIVTVLQDREQKTLAETNQYEVVRDIVAILARRGKEGA